MRATLRMILYLTAFLVGAALLAYHLLGVFQPTWQHFCLKQAVDSVNQPEGRIATLGIATVFLICPLSILLRWWQIHRHAREISYSTESGRVSVSLIAVEEALARAVENESCVKKGTVRLYEDRVKRQVIIDCVLVLWEVPNVTERNRACQQILRRRFAELMPEQSAVQVNLNVHRLTPRREERKGSIEVPAPGDQSAASEPTQLAAGEVPFAGTSMGRGGANDDERHPPIHGMPAAAPEAGRERETVSANEDDLYVGPSYPVESDDDAAEGANYLGQPIPVGGSPVKSKSRQK